MPSPVSPQTLSALVPPRNGSFCGRFIPGIINWMQERANYWRWVYKDNGDFTVSFITDLCIAVNGVVVPDPTTCPAIAFTSKILSRHESLILTFTGAGMIAGYAWNLYRATSISGPWGAAITSGTTDGSVISYTNTGLTNDTAYFYKLTVARPGCPLTSYQASGTPRLCLAFDFTLTLATDYTVDPPFITVSIANVDPDYPMDNSFTYDLLVDGVSLVTGNINAFPMEINSGIDPGLRLITVEITEKAGCAAKSHSGNVLVYSPRLPSPGLVVMTDGTMAWNAVPGALYYRIYMMSLRECEYPNGGGTIAGFPYPVDEWLPIGTRQASDPRTFPITRNIFRANYSPGGTIQPRSVYNVYVAAVGAGNIEGYPSNQIGINKWLGGQQCGT